MRHLRVLLDTNVWFDAQLRDLFLELHARGLIEICWTQHILDELQKALVRRRRTVTPDTAERLCAAIADVLADGEVIGYSLIPTNDPDDDAVLGAAVHAECDILVTLNRSDFPSDAACDGLGIEISDIDYTMATLIQDIGVAALADAFTTITEALRQPPLTVDEQLNRLRSVAALTAATLGNHLRIDEYVTMYATLRGASGEGDPRRTIDELLVAAAAGNTVAVGALLSDRLRGQLNWPTAWQPALLEHLGPVLSEPHRWAYATAPRVMGDRREMIKLVRTGGGVTIAAHPMVLPAVMFELVFEQQQGWLIDRVGFEDPDLDLT